MSGTETYEKVIQDLKKEIEKLKKQKYGIIWEDHAEKLNESSFPMIEELKGKRVSTGEKDPINLLIEGDNYHSLKSLLYTHKEKIDVIYIDPPYNTGSKDFVYNDKMVEEEDSWRHSKWLSFMNKRLVLAKKLLDEAGVIFISIDDNEMSQLKLLCDKIFRPENFIVNLKWFKNINGRQLDKHFANTSEYILVYGKNKEKFTLNLEIETSEDKLKNFKFKDEIGLYKRGDFLSNNNGSKFNNKTRPNLTYAVYYNPKTNEAFTKDEKIPQTDGTYTFDEKNSYQDEGFVKILPPIRPETGFGCWRWGRDKFANEYKTELMFEKNTKNEWKVYTKSRAASDGVVYKKPKDYLKIPGVNGSTDLSNILGKNVFQHPKPVALIKWLVDRHTNKNALVLDFFAGSGTTGQAILEMNKEDGGTRSFILCTNNENQICENVTYKRVRKVIEGYENAKGEVVGGLGGNLKYYKTIEVGDINKQTDEELEAVIAHSTELLKVKHACYNDSVRNEKYLIAEKGDEQLAILTNSDFLEEFIEVLQSSKKRKKVYIFSWSEESYNLLVQKIKNKIKNIEFKHLPNDIIHFYRSNKQGGENNE